MLNKVISFAYVNVMYLKFPKLDLNSTRIVGYSDAVFTNNHDLK